MTHILTAYFAERERSGGKFLAEAVLDLFEHRTVAHSVMLRGIAGFGATHVLRGDRKLSLSEDPPVTITAVDTADRITTVADQVAALTGRGLITVAPTSTASQGWVRLTLHAGRRHVDHVAACAVLQRCGFAAAEVFLGVDGTVAGQRRRARFFGFNHDVPVMISGVGTAEQAAAAHEQWHGMSPGALVTKEPVRVCKKDGETVAGLDGMGGYLRLTVRTSEDALFRGEPVHRALVRRLRNSEHAAGATTLRGVWGFRGAELPHGDRFFQLARHVPVRTVMIDTAENLAASFAVVDELTTHAGLITVEAVPVGVIRHGEQTLRLV